MRGLAWNLEQSKKIVLKRIIRAVKKGMLIAPYEDEQTDYFCKKIADPVSKRNTKAYYYQLSLELAAIVNVFSIYASDEVINKVKESRMKFYEKELLEQD